MNYDEYLKQKMKKCQIENDTALNIIDMIKEVFYGDKPEDINFRVEYGLYGCVEKVIAMIEEIYEIRD